MDGRDERYRPWVPGCGVIPNSIYDIAQVQPAEPFTANLCLPVKSTSVARGLDLYLQVVGGHKMFFALGPPSGG